MVNNNKGVSPVIATVLLLVLTIVIVSILAVFVIPFVKDSLAGSKDCFAVLGDIKFDTSSSYNCFYTNSSNGLNRTGFSVRIDGDEVISFSTTLYRQGSANPYTIENGANLSVLRMLNEDFAQPLEVPSNGGVRTYVANDLFDRVEVNPILKTGKLCKAEETVTLERCSPDPTIINNLFLH